MSVKGVKLNLSVFEFLILQHALSLLIATDSSERLMALDLYDLFTNIGKRKDDKRVEVIEE